MRHKKPFESKSEFNEWTKKKQHHLDKSWKLKTPQNIKKMKKLKRDLKNTIEELENRVKHHIYENSVDGRNEKRLDQRELNKAKFDYNEIKQQTKLF